MLIWIKAPCVAIGFLAVFILLLSVADSQNIFITSSPDDNTTIELTETETNQTIQLMQLPFANDLISPCAPETSGRYIDLAGHRSRFEADFFEIISYYAGVFKEDARTVLRNHTFNGCENLHVTNLPGTPTLEELQEMSQEEAFLKIYSSALMHLAYANFIHYQHFNSPISCSENIYGEQRLANESRTLASKQKFLACTIRVGMTALGYNQYDVSMLLNETVTDLKICSRRALRDCQVIKSLHNFLHVVTEYSKFPGRPTETSY